MKKHIPNILTLLNLFAGCIALVAILEGNLITGAWLIGVAAVFDFLDGFAARLLKVSSGIGKELDSLADVVSFGLVPGTIMFMLIRWGFEENSVIHLILPYAGFIVTLFSALRLAKFNTDERQSDAFYGLPTPANAMLIGSFPLILAQEGTLIGLPMEPLHAFLSQPFVILILSVILSVMLVADIRLLALKFKTSSWAENQSRYILIILSILWLLLFGFAGIPLVIMTYLILSLSMKV